jgi:protocatechuate 3,4-dioxygenase alpha subunit
MGARLPLRHRAARPRARRRPGLSDARPDPSQTVGPFFHFLSWPGAETLIKPDTQGERIEITGRVLDGDGAPVPDALIEIWQANAAGRYAHTEDGQTKPLDPAFHGFGRCASDAEGRFRFATIRPGRVPGRGNALQAPHINLGLFARGLLRRLVTRIYFEGAPENAEDPVLALVQIRPPCHVAGQACRRRKRRLSLRHRPAGQRRDRVLRVLMPMTALPRRLCSARSS